MARPTKKRKLSAESASREVLRPQRSDRTPRKSNDKSTTTPAEETPGKRRYSRKSQNLKNVEIQQAEDAGVTEHDQALLSRHKSSAPARPSDPDRPRRTKKSKEMDKPEESEVRNDDPPKKRRAKIRSNHRNRSEIKPTLLKQKSDAADVALKKIAELVNPSDSSSDTSIEALTNAVKDEQSSAEDEDDIFEDVDITTKNKPASSKFDLEVDDSDQIELTLEKAERLQLAKTGKKKQSARAVHERCFAHYMSLITMVALGAWRNSWINDAHLGRFLRQILRRKSPALHSELKSAARAKVSSSHAFVELMGRVMNKFHSMFTRNKHGLRKLGHRPVAQMDAGKEYEDLTETFDNVESFVEQARSLAGSRDFGAQLFTALLRAYHFKVRLVFSTQPLGYKFNEREEFKSSTIQEALQALKPRDDTVQDYDKATIKEETDAILIDDESKQDIARETTSKRSKMSKPRARILKAGTKEHAISLDESDLSELHSDDFVSDPDLLSDLDDLGDFTEQNASKRTQKPVPMKEDVPDAELEYPIWWTEIWDAGSMRWVAIDAMVKRVVLVDEKGFKSLHPRGHLAEKQKLTLGFVVAYDANKRAKDVTTRYASSWAKVKEVCLRADGKSNTRYDANRILCNIGNPYRDAQERLEDDTLAFKEVKLPPVDAMPTTLAEFKASPKYLLEHQLREKEAFKPKAKPVDTFNAGKGAKAINSKVFLRSDVIPCKTIENYHKEGRRVRAAEQPRKMIKARAMTTNRIREHQQQMAETGEEHVMQGIYSIDQTEYIIPPPIVNGIIPKNAYGNADVFVESMIPKGATHLKLKGVARIARKLEMNHAEAVVGFEFKKRGAIPVVLGVLVADENAAELEAAWHEAEEIRIRKEDKKRTDAALKMWSKFLKGLRIRKRINAEYGISEDVGNDQNGTMNVKEPVPQKSLLEQVGPGGFVREDEDAG